MRFKTKFRWLNPAICNVLLFALFPAIFAWGSQPAEVGKFESIKQADQPMAAAMLTRIRSRLGFDSQTMTPPPRFTEAADLIADRYADSPDNYLERKRHERQERTAGSQLTQRDDQDCRRAVTILDDVSQNYRADTKRLYLTRSWPKLLDLTCANPDLCEWSFSQALPR